MGDLEEGMETQAQVGCLVQQELEGDTLAQVGCLDLQA